MRFWCCWEALEEVKDGRYNMELVVGSGVLNKIRFQEALLEYELGGRRRGFFAEFFGFLFDNTSQFYLCLHLSSLLLFISFYCCVALNMD